MIITAIRAFEGNLHTAIRAFEGNLHDRQTIQPLWEQHESIVGQAPKELVVD
ncbi:MAG: hypothetical protein OXE77_11025 [Flavobacteriaceae bacterium]|nr:hypothetical protein [Flavobacteriaceae bacterium]MCY4268136.1 hypothetical protein [Flavobacteriaceae bacterium]